MNATSNKCFWVTPSVLMSVYFFITRIKSITSNKMKERECKNFIIKVFAFISSNLLSKNRIEATLNINVPLELYNIEIKRTNTKK